MPDLWINGLLGGLLIGLAAAAFLLLNGRIAGISSLIGASLNFSAKETPNNLAFLIGIVLGAWALAEATGSGPIAVDRSVGLLIAGGLLVGFGTRLGSGCTSGHGVCGMSCLSKRSIVATLIFMATAIAAVAARGWV